MNYMKIQSLTVVSKFLKFTGNLHSKVLTLDKVDGVSIRDHDLLTQKKIELKVIAENLIQTFFKTGSKRWVFPRRYA